MLKERYSLRRPAIVFAASLVLSILAFIFIGFPGACGFSGKYGDDIAQNTFGACVALGLFLLPILGLIASAIWWLRTLILRPTRIL